jgi:Tol biopolymer transport system component/Tfp pilus assembly protein PilF
VADYYNWAGAWSVLPPAESFAAAKEAAAKAVALDSSLAETQTAYGYSLWNYDWAWEEAERAFRRALERNDSYVVSHTFLAFLLSARGTHEEAATHARKAAALDSSSAGVTACLCLVLFNAGEWDSAESAARQACSATENNVTALLSLAWVLSAKGLHEEAISRARQALTLAQDNPWGLATLATALAAAAQPSEARRILAALYSRAETLPTSRYHLALIHTALGEEEQALACLDRSADDREWWIRFLPVDPRLSRLRRHPHCTELASRLRTSPGIAPHPAESEPPALLPGRSRHSLRAILTGAALAVVVLAVVLGIALGVYRRVSGETAAPFFHAPQFTKITTSGNATLAALSPDGQYIAYALDEGGKYSLWVRQASISNGVRILPESDSMYRGLTFSRDGAWIYYVIYGNNQITRGTLYRIPTLGGTPHKIAENVSGAIGLSPDSKRQAFLRSDMVTGEDDLIVAEADGSRQSKVASRKFPGHFAYSSSPAWSPDGRMIAVAAENTDAEGFYVGLVGIRLKDGSQQTLSTRRWQYVEQIAWLPGNRGLLLVGRDQESSFQQIWHIVSPAAPPRRVTNDLNDYYGLSLTADSGALVSSQAQTLSNVWILPPSGNARRVSAGYGRYFDLSLATGKIIYASDASGHADIWSMDADGGNQHQLTSSAHRNYSPAVSPDNRFIAFHSNRSGTWNIWRMNLDGGDLRQLTNDANDSNWPVWTPDGKFLVYHHITAAGYQTIWKIPAEGGPPVQLTDRFALRPAVSPKDGTVACWYSEEPASQKWEIAVLPPNGGRPLKKFAFPPTTSVDSTLRWTPDGKGIAYTDFRGGVSNVWVQSIDGGPPRQITGFNSDRIFSLDWSPAGDLIYSRGLRTNDIVLITDVK